MQLKKAFNFLKSLPVKLNNFYNKRSKYRLVVKNKSNKKKDFDPVTNLDKSFEQYIRFLINQKFPNHSIIGEEFKNKNSFSDYTWSIDPIDGTRAFVIGAPTWSNLISLSFQKRSFLGLANFPELNKYYINDKNNSYIFNNKKKKIMKSSYQTNLSKIKIIGNFHGAINYDKQRKVIRKFGPSFRIAGFDALNYCLLADGKVDAVIEGNLKPYDILPLIPIIQNSGGVVSNWSGESAEKGGNIIASSNIKLHYRILKILKPFTKK